MYFNPEIIGSKALHCSHLLLYSVLSYLFIVFYVSDTSRQNYSSRLDQFTILNNNFATSDSLACNLFDWPTEPTPSAKKKTRKGKGG